MAVKRISWVEGLLLKWAKHEQIKGHLGYPSVSPMFRDTPRPDVYGSGRPDFGYSGSDVDECDKAVKSLPMIPRTVVIVHYQHSKSLNDTARQCGVTPQTAGKHIEQAHQAIARFLDDRRRFQSRG